MRVALCFAFILGGCASSPRNERTAPSVMVDEARMYFLGQPGAPSQTALQKSVNAVIAGDDAELAYVVSLVRFTDGEGALNFGDLLLQLQRAVGSDRFARVLATVPSETRDLAQGCMKAAQETRRAYEAHSTT